LSAGGAIRPEKQAAAAAPTAVAAAAPATAPGMCDVCLATSPGALRVLLAGP